MISSQFVNRQNSRKKASMPDQFYLPFWPKRTNFFEYQNKKKCCKWLKREGKGSIFFFFAWTETSQQQVHAFMKFSCCTGLNLVCTGQNRNFWTFLGGIALISILGLWTNYQKPETKIFFTHRNDPFLNEVSPQS